jgi:hypothetical protein
MMESEGCCGKQTNAAPGVAVSPPVKCGYSTQPAEQNDAELTETLRDAPGYSTLPPRVSG